jgi:hypothetical protein
LGGESSPFKFFGKISQGRAPLPKISGKSQRGELPFQSLPEKLKGETSPSKDLQKISEGEPPL